MDDQHDVPQGSRRDEPSPRHRRTQRPGVGCGPAAARGADPHLPVVEHDDRLVGIISERDLRGAAFSSILWDLSPSLRARFEQARQALEEIEVGDVMTREPVTTTPDARLAEAAAQMFEHRIGCLPVVEGGCLVGLSTEADALAALADSLGHVLVWSWSGSSAPRAGSEHVLGHDSARPRGRVLQRVRDQRARSELDGTPAVWPGPPVRRQLSNGHSLGGYLPSFGPVRAVTRGRPPCGRRGR
jgi:CBS domain